MGRTKRDNSRAIFGTVYKLHSLQLRAEPIYISSETNYNQSYRLTLFELDQGIHVNNPFPNLVFHIQAPSRIWMGENP